MQPTAIHCKGASFIPSRVNGACIAIWASVFGMKDMLEV